MSTAILERPITAVDRGPWGAAINPVVQAVEEAASGLDVSAEEILAALLARYGLGGDILADGESEVIARQLGPFLSSRAVQQRAGISRQALHGRRSRWAIIGVPTDDHTEPLVYPVRQFVDLRAATVLPGVREIATALAEVIPDALTIATWLDSANPDLGGRTAYEWLAEGGEINEALASAARDARRLAQ